eukprot:TRINITY_DN27022_c0_g1_i1.p1 TRINITY_DN27022_c0_g1~~TRINITY_DN27022_c0_g1_i1.p1  ORF type:complete len:529 (+),score=156.80 TRINITY_DN27022_c0_g1_i1:155-1741(+)
MAPKAKSKPAAKAKPEPAPKATAKGKAAPKAKAGPGSPAAGSGTAAVRQSQIDAAAREDLKDPKVVKAEELLRECLEEKEIAKVDGRVLDIAVLQGRNTEGVDKELLSRGEARLEEYRAFEEELKKRAEELRAKKDEVIARQNEENEAFAEAFAARQKLKQDVEDMFEAVGDSDLDKVKRYVTAWAKVDDSPFPAPPLPIDLEDHEGNTPLSEAACYGESEIVEYLLKSGAHPNARSQKGRTPVWRACYNGHEEVVKMILEGGGNPSIENTDGEPAGKHGTDATKKLIQSWDKSLTEERQEDLSPLQRLEYPWPHLLLDACQAGDEGAVEKILKAIKDNNAGGGLSGTTLLRTILDFEDMADALWMACTKGHLGLCKQLLDAGADPDSFSMTGLTCLMISCRKGHTAIAKELMARGAKTHLRSEQGRLASDYAREYGDGHCLHDIVVEHCRKIEDWSTLEEEARQSGGNKACDVEVVDDLLEGRRNAQASNAATAALKGLSLEEIRSGSDNYKDLLEQRALADVLGIS